MMDGVYQLDKHLIQVYSNKLYVYIVFVCSVFAWGRLQLNQNSDRPFLIVWIKTNFCCELYYTETLKSPWQMQFEFNIKNSAVEFWFWFDFELILFYFHFHLMYKNIKRLTEISTVKEEVERAKYSKLMMCPLIKYIYFRIKSKLERKELMHSNKYVMLELSILSKIKLVKCFFK